MNFMEFVYFCALLASFFMMFVQAMLAIEDRIGFRIPFRGKNLFLLLVPSGTMIALSLLENVFRLDVFNVFAVVLYAASAVAVVLNTMLLQKQHALDWMAFVQTDRYKDQSARAWEIYNALPGQS